MRRECVAIWRVQWDAGNVSFTVLARRTGVECAVTQPSDAQEPCFGTCNHGSCGRNPSWITSARQHLRVAVREKRRRGRARVDRDTRIGIVLREIEKDIAERVANRTRRREWMRMPTISQNRPRRKRRQFARRAMLIISARMPLDKLAVSSASTRRYA